MKTDLHIPGYKIMRELGHGGMAHVYLAIQESFGREVALKILSPHLTDDDQFSKRFLREARIVSQLNHPNIVTVFDAGRDGKYHYMSMEYIPGKDLKQIKDSLSRKDAIRVIKDVARALNYAGEKGIVHRDVKPENIMIHAIDKRVILMDFGIAHGDDVTHGMTQTGKAIGTPHFMSPEQTKGMKVDHRSDIYSLGVVLYQLLAGHLPFDASSAVAVGIKHLTAPIPLLPTGLEIFQPIVNTCLSKQPEHRYQKAAELIAALEMISDEQIEQINSQAILFKQAGTDHHSETQISNTRVVAQKRRIPALIFPSNKNNSRNNENSGSNNTHPTRRRNLLIILLLCSIAFAANERQHDLADLWGNQLLPKIAANYPELFPKSYVDFWKMKNEPDTAKNIQTAIVPVLQYATLPDTISIPSGQLPDEMPAQIALPETQQQVVKPLSIQGKITLLKDGLDDNPINAVELATLYKNLLQQEQQNTVAHEGLKDLREWYIEKIRQTFITNDMEKAHHYVEIMKQSFPRATKNSRFTRLEEKIALQDLINLHMKNAEKFFSTGALSKPVNDNALSEIRIILNIAPDYEPALKFIDKIATTYLNETSQLQNQGNLHNALRMVEEGIAALDNNAVLLSKREEIKTIMADNNFISSTLKQAQQYITTGNFIEPEGWSAYDMYQKVLGKDTNNLQAKAGLKTVHQKLANKIISTIRNGQFTQAELQLQAAIKRFGKTPMLANVNLKLNDAVKARQTK